MIIGQFDDSVPFLESHLVVSAGSAPVRRNKRCPAGRSSGLTPCYTRDRITLRKQLLCQAVPEPGRATEDEASFLLVIHAHIAVPLPLVRCRTSSLAQRGPQCALRGPATPFA